MFEFLHSAYELVKSSTAVQHSITAVVSAGAAYFFGRHRRRAELDNLRAESETHRLNHLRQLDEIDKAFREADRRFVDACKVFRDSHDLPLNDKHLFEKAREELCAVFCDLLLHKTNNFRCHCRVDRNDPNHLEALIDSTVSDLREWQRHLSATNNIHVIDYLGCRPLTIKRHTLQPIRVACKELKLPPNAFDALNRAIDDLILDSIEHDH